MRPATPEAVTEVASQLDNFCPPLEQEKEAKKYLWMLWDIMLNIATSPDVTSEIQNDLVEILQSLRQIAKGELAIWNPVKQRVWADIPMLGYCMEAHDAVCSSIIFEWVCLICLVKDPTAGLEDFTPRNAQIWLIFNLFAARCLGAELVGLYPSAMQAMRSALEEDLSTDEMSMRECKIKVACAWIVHGPRRLLVWAIQNVGFTDVPLEDVANYVEGGSLYHEPSCMCLQRWSFWQDRFEELGKEESGISEEIRMAVVEAVQTMRTVESRMGHTLSE